MEEEGQSLGVEEEEEEGQSLGVVEEEAAGGPFQVEVVEDPYLVVEVVGVEAVQTLVEVQMEKSPGLAEEEEEEAAAGGHHLVKVEVVAEVEAHLR